jgi:hypothetical protein
MISCGHEKRRQLQGDPEKTIPFFQFPSLKYAACLINIDTLKLISILIAPVNLPLPGAGEGACPASMKFRSPRYPREDRPTLFACRGPRRLWYMEPPCRGSSIHKKTVK